MLPAILLLLLRLVTNSVASLAAAAAAASAPCLPPDAPCHGRSCCKNYLCPLAGPDASCNATTPRLPGAVDVFVGGGARYSLHRIPALVRARDGSLLVFAQAAGLPANSSDVVLKRSSSGGRLWSKEQAVVSQAAVGGLPVANPSPVVLASGRVLLVCTPGNKEVWIFTSDTHGASWSSGRNITSQASRPEWTWVATGPPQGLLLAYGAQAGRVVIGADHRVGQASGSHAIFSDDGGENWRISSQLEDKRGPCESQVALAPNGSLLLNMRSHDAIRLFAWSNDRGESWGPISDKPFHSLRYGGGYCEGSTIAVPASDLLAFSTPFVQPNPPAGSGVDTRANLTIFLSRDNGLSWPGVVNVDPGRAQYSSLLGLNDTHIALVYEGGCHIKASVPCWIRFSVVDISRSIPRQLGLKADDEASLAGLPSTPVFTMGEGGYHCFRIASVLLVGDNSTGGAKRLAAFAEARKWTGDGCHSYGAPPQPPAPPFPRSAGFLWCVNVDIGMKTSADAGQTWSLLKIIAFEACQPTAVWDWQRHRLLLAFNSANYSTAFPFASNMRMYSINQGDSWSDAESYVHQLGTVVEETGPGLGLQLSPRHPQAGRILFIGSKFIHSHQGFVWYSDDGGSTFRLSNTTFANTNEAQLVELPDGRIMANLRSQGLDGHQGVHAPHCRLVSTSSDGGASFGRLVWEHSLPGPRCFASIFRPFWGATANNGSTPSIYFSNPADEKSRINGLIRRSFDGYTWSSSLQVTSRDDEFFSYSCLTQLPASAFAGGTPRMGLMWEKGVVNDGRHVNLTRIVFSSFNADFSSEVSNPQQLRPQAGDKQKAYDQQPSFTESGIVPNASVHTTLKDIHLSGMVKTDDETSAVKPSAVQADDVGQQVPRLNFITQSNKPVIDTRMSPGTEDNAFGFEGGRVIEQGGVLWLFTAELARAPVDAFMRCALWTASSASGPWKRVGTIAESNQSFPLQVYWQASGDQTTPSKLEYTAEYYCDTSDLAASPWAPMPLWDAVENCWHVLYVGYTCDFTKPWLASTGNIFGAASTVSGLGGITGPYEKYGIVAGANATPPTPNLPAKGWGGLNQIGPYILPNRTFAAFIAATHRFATAKSPRGPWQLGPTISAISTPLSNFNENPTPSMLRNPRDNSTVFVVVFDTVAHEGGGFGMASSTDGVHWRNGVDVVLPNGCRTPLGLIQDADGKAATLLFTRRFPDCNNQSAQPASGCGGANCIMPGQCANVYAARFAIEWHKLPLAVKTDDSAPLRCEETLDVDFWGADLLGPGGKLRPLPTNTSAACCALCTGAAPRCGAWSWNRQDALCFLKSDPGVPRAKPGDISGRVVPGATSFADFDLVDNFAFGVVMDAYQFEGSTHADGRGPSNLDVWCHWSMDQAACQGVDGCGWKVCGDVGAGFYKHWKEDVALMAAMGQKHLHFQIAWTRILPDGGSKVNELGVKFYSDLLDELIAHGITPWVSLEVFDFPQVYVRKYGGWLGRGIVDEYTRFATLCFKLFGDRVAHWFSFHEPNTFCEGYVAPWRFVAPRPNANDSTIPDLGTDHYKCIHNMLLSHGHAAQALRQAPNIDSNKVTFSLISGLDWATPFNASEPSDVAAAERQNLWAMGIWFDPLVFGHYPKEVREAAGDRLPKFTAAESALLKNSSHHIAYTSYGSVMCGAPAPSPPPSTACKFLPNTTYTGGVAGQSLGGVDEAGCCGYCRSNPNCSAAVLDGTTCYPKTVAAKRSVSTTGLLSCVVSGSAPPPAPPSSRCPARNRKSWPSDAFDSDQCGECQGLDPAHMDAGNDPYLRGATNWCWLRYGRPVIVAESGIGLNLAKGNQTDSGNVTASIDDDVARVSKLRSVWTEAHKAIRDGANLAGIFHWSFLDNLEWGSGYSLHFGLVFVDHRTKNLTRTPKTSAWWMKGVVEQNGFVSNSTYTPPSKSNYPWNAYPTRPPSMPA